MTIPETTITTPRKKPTRKTGRKRKVKKKKPKIKRHRTKKGKKGEWLTYEEMKTLAQARGLKSRQQFFDYYDTHKPLYFSRFPYNLYKEEWVSWADFLGTNNLFNSDANKIKAKSLKPYWEAVRQLQPLKLTSHKEYKRMVKSGELPGFSLYPDNHYKEEWTSWPDYLSKNVAIKIEMAQSSKPIWVVVHTSGDPENVVWFLKISSIELLHEQIKPGWKILAKYWYEENLHEIVWNIIERNSNSHFDKEQRLCNNVNQLLWELSSELLIIK
jgi:hypothetical protein